MRKRKIQSPPVKSPYAAEIKEAVRKVVEQRNKEKSNETK